MSHMTNLTLGLSWLALNVLAAGGAYLCYYMGWFSFTKQNASDKKVLLTLTEDEQKKRDDNFKPQEPIQQGF